MADIELRLIANNEQYISGIKEAQNAQQSLNDNFKAGENAKKDLIQNTVSAIDKETASLKASEKAISTTGESLKSQLRKIKQDLSLMEQAGLDGTKAFMQMSIRAGELEDQIGDTNQQIRILASDTKNLDAAMSMGTGLAGGFALAEGAMAVFGTESENLQRQLVKLQGGMNILNGLQSVANTLNKDSAARIVLAAKAQQFYSLAVGTSTGAMKAFRVALLATGIGALIVGIGLLIANWDKLKVSIQNLTSPNAELARQIEKQTKLNEELRKSNESRIKDIDREIALLEAQGAKEEELFNLKRDRKVIELKDQLRDIELTKKRLEYTIKEISAREAANQVTAHSGGALGLLYAKLLNNTKSLKENQEDLNKQLFEQNEAYKDIENEIKVLEAQEVKRKKSITDKSIEKSQEEQRKNYEKFIELLKQLADKEQAAKLSILSGKDRINAEEQLQLQEVELLKTHLEGLGNLTKEQYQQIEIIKNSVKINAQKERDKIDQDELNKTTEQNEKIKNLQRKIDEDQLELIGAGESEKLKLKIRFLQEDLKAVELKGDAESKLIAENIRQQIGIIENDLNKTSENSFNIWKLFGLDPESEQGKAAIDSLKESTSIIMDQINQVMQAEIAQAEQHTQLIEQRLNEAEQQLDKELELQKDGYANNVDAKKQEISQLKAEREKSLKEEEKAKNQQLLLDSAVQASSLVTATAKIIESFSALPIIGQILAVLAIASMWGTFTAAKVKAAEMTKLEMGASGDSTGIIKGNRHSQGGEKFSDHIEVEAGERWGVWNRNASNKYGEFIPYLVDSMNNLKFPMMDFKGGQTIVNIDTKKMQSKLDSINDGIKVLNDNFLNRSDIFYSGKTRVEKISKNHIRIIHAKN